jgi:formate hydrogenlyase transcriptional activator
MKHSAASEKLIWRRNQRQSELALHIWRIAMNLTDVSDLDFRDGNSQFASIAASSLSMNKKPYLEEEGRSEAGFPGIVGQSRALQEVLQLVEMVATTDSTVLLLGETGTGKELIARAVHDRSHRKDRKLVKLNCAAIPSGLLESELFGHERGAFTGAITQKIGRLELADQGTLFLDEIGDIPLELQPKLLRAVQEREFERLGSTHTKKVDVRFVAATHRNLEEMIWQKQFRQDLYYRLNIFPISIPPLRERPEDIPLLVRHFVRQFARRMNKNIERISPETMQALTRYPWPGNIRELQNVIERSVVVYEKGNLSVKKSWLSREYFPTDPATQPLFKRSAMEGREMIDAALAEARGRVSGPSGAAAKLGIPPSTLESKIRSMNIDKYRFRATSTQTA